ncbi:MAG: esterase YqiA [Gammaproteobacteria bacterium]|nr:MAG: esterase YqiA [Gammaproteobacteria bacterium]
MSARHLFYIHGFNSSPQSAKARLLANYLETHASELVADIQFHVPQLPYSPDKGIQILEQAVQGCLPEPVLLVGSSMGGFYGTYIAEKYDLPLVLVNPAVKPYELLQDYLGENENIYTGEKYTFTREHIQTLKKLDVTPITKPQRYYLLTQTADEVLDYQQGVEKYQGAQQIIQQGGSHGFDGFENEIAGIMQFLRLSKD